MKYFPFLICISVQSFCQDIQSLDAATFSFAMMNNQVAQVIDLRATKAFNEGHIKKAVSIDYDNDDFQAIAETKIDKNRTLYIYDQTGKNGKNACLFLKEIGFREVYYLDGGFTNWTSTSHPYVSSKSNTKAIAAFTKNDLLSIVSSNPKVLLFLYDTDNKLYKTMEPLVNRNTGKDSGIKTLKLDLKKELTITEYLEVKVSPTLIFFKNGKQVWKNSGEISEIDLQSILFQ